MDMLNRPAVAGAVGAGSMGDISNMDGTSSHSRLGLRPRRQGGLRDLDGPDADFGVETLEQPGSRELEQRRLERGAKETNSDWRLVVKEMLNGQMGAMGLFR